jgi:hypothetical protein
MYHDVGKRPGKKGRREERQVRYKVFVSVAAEWR